MIVSTNRVKPSSLSVPPMITGSTRVVNARVLMLLPSWVTMNCASTAPSASCMAAG